MSNNYAGMRRAFEKDVEGLRRCAKRLRDIRAQMADVRKRKSDGSLLLATWNIRDFDSNKFGYGFRLTESFYYIAEIMASFDLIAVQEVNDDLAALERVMKILGREWDYIVTDTTEGSGGNVERMAFVYNTEKVWFRKIAGEVVLPEGQRVRKAATAKPAATADADVAPVADPGDTDAGPDPKNLQFARSPFLVAFQSGWFCFSLCTVHIYYGAASGEKLARRIEEIRKLVDFFAKRQDKEIAAAKARGRQPENYILLGDFNVVSPVHKTMAALKSQGFSVPAAIDGKTVRKKDSHFYDQIAVRVGDPRFEVRGGGMVDMYDRVFRETPEDIALYAAAMPAQDPDSNARARAKTPEALYRKWRTWQMSDHHPLWIEIATDFADDYLDRIVNPPQA